MLCTYARHLQKAGDVLRLLCSLVDKAVTASSSFCCSPLFTCICTVFIDSEHLRFGSSAVGAKEERKTGNSEKKNSQTPIQENFLLRDILEMLLLSEYVRSLVRKYQHIYCPFNALPTRIW